MPGELNVSWGRAASVWWSWLWRTILTSVVLSVLLGIVFGSVAAVIGMGPDAMLITANLMNAAVSLLVGLYYFKSIFELKYKGFRVALVATDT